MFLTVVTAIVKEAAANNQTAASTNRSTKRFKPSLGDRQLGSRGYSSDLASGAQDRKLSPPHFYSVVVLVSLMLMSICYLAFMNFHH